MMSDLTNKLASVLRRFSRRKITIIADVEAMFYQVKIRREHRAVLRYLWWPDDSLVSEPITFKMTAHPFGGV